MLFKTGSITGITYGRGTLKSATLKWHRGRLEIKECREISLSSPEQISFKGPLVSCLEAQFILVRQLEMRLTPSDNIDAALPFQAEPILPYPLEEAIIQKKILLKKERSTVVTLFSARKNHLEEHLRELSDVGIVPEGVSCAAEALTALLRASFPETEIPTLVLYVERQKALFLLMQQGYLLAARSITYGSEEPFGFQKEVKKTLYAFTSSHCLSPDEPLHLLGEEVDYAALHEMLQRTLLPLSSPRFSKEIFDKYALAVGTALASEEKQCINFRQGAFAAPYPWRRLRRVLGLYFGLVLGAAALFSGMGVALLKNKEDALKENYFELLCAMEREEREEIASLALSEVVERVDLLEEEWERQGEVYPLFPKIPTLSDLLAHLRGQMDDRISLERLHYAVVRHPNLSQRGEPYQVRVVLTFSTAQAAAAREVHEALLADEQFIETSSGIEWSANKGSYTASFYLKDRTIYP